MKAVLQRASFGSVVVDGKTVGEIKGGIVALIGIGNGDTETDLAVACEKITNLRIFEDENGKMNKSLLDVDGEILLVPNFTLYSDISHGRRPFFSGGAPFEDAKVLFEKFVSMFKETEIKNVASGIFGADMKLSLLNDGPVTIILDTNDLKK